MKHLGSTQLLRRICVWTAYMLLGGYLCDSCHSPRLATGWTVQGSNLGAGEIFRTCPDRSLDHPASCTMGTGSFQGVKGGRGVRLAPHPLPVPWSRKSKAIPVHALWTVQPVQTLSACTTVHICHPPHIAHVHCSNDILS